MQVKTNREDESLYCTWCKRLIAIGEKYGIFEEEYMDDTIKKYFHLDCLEENSEEDDVYISDTPDDEVPGDNWPNIDCDEQE